MGRDFLDDAIGAVSTPFVSLNALDAETKKFIGRPFIIKNSGKLKIAIVGLTDPLDRARSPAEPPSAGHSSRVMKPSAGPEEGAPDARVEVVDPMDALEKNLPLIAAQSDVIVLLSSLSPKRNAAIAYRFPEINVILGTDSEGRSGLSGSTLIANNQSDDGKKIGKLSLTLDREGNILDEKVDWLHIRKTLAENPAIRGHLNEFYTMVAENEEFWEEVEPLLTSFDLEGDKANKYIGALKCASCHEKIYATWKKSKHASAYTTLVQENRFFYPDCVNCHTTGAGYASGFRIDQTTKHLEGVQCEVCHGPGGRHLATEGTFDLRATSGKGLCRECHNADVSPEFEDHFEGMLAKVDHSDIPTSLRTNEKKAAKDRSRRHPNLIMLKKADSSLYERLFKELAAGCRSNHLLFECRGESASGKRSYLDELLETDRDFDLLMSKMVGRYGESVKSTEKERARYRLRQQSVVEALQEAIDETGSASLEIYVMSYGAKAIKAENLLFELRDEATGGKIELSLRFIATEVEQAASSADGKSNGNPGRFKSHNGQREIDENIRQLLVQKYHPEKLRRYLSQRNASVTKTDWRNCARAAGIHPEEIERRTASGEGADLLSRDIELAKAKKITVSPTLLINGEKFLGKYIR